MNLNAVGYISSSYNSILMNSLLPLQNFDFSFGFLFINRKSIDIYLPFCTWGYLFVFASDCLFSIFHNHMSHNPLLRFLAYFGFLKI